MGKPTTNWESVETWQRLVSSILATGYKVSKCLPSNLKTVTDGYDSKPDLKTTAIYFGTTYDTLENRFRKLKKEAETLKAEVERGERGELTVPSRPKSAPTTPRKPKTPKKEPLESMFVPLEWNIVGAIC